jgi:hypothetical protein
LTGRMVVALFTEVREKLKSNRLGGSPAMRSGDGAPRG